MASEPRPLLVLRPEPGNAATMARIAARGLSGHALPLFAVVPCRWSPPDPARFDALLLTSANAVRHAGPELASLAALPVIAVGEATATAARSAGLQVALVGFGDAASVVAQARAAGHGALLRLSGRDYTPLPGVTDVCVYASEALAIVPGDLAVARGRVVLLHSARAARTFAALIDRDAVPRTAVRLAALSPAVAAAAGGGWGDVAVAAAPTDAALFDAIMRD